MRGLACLQLAICRQAGLRVLRIFISATDEDYKSSGSQERVCHTCAHMQGALSWTVCQAVDDIETKQVGTYDDRILTLVDDLMLEAPLAVCWDFQAWRALPLRGVPGARAGHQAAWPEAVGVRVSLFCFVGIRRLDIAMHDRYSLGCWRADAYVAWQIKHTESLRSCGCPSDFPLLQLQVTAYNLPNANSTCDTKKNQVEQFYTDPHIQVGLHVLLLSSSKKLVVVSEYPPPPLSMVGWVGPF